MAPPEVSRALSINLCRLNLARSPLRRLDKRTLTRRRNSAIPSSTFPGRVPGGYNATLHQAMFLSNNLKWTNCSARQREHDLCSSCSKTPEAQTKLIFERLLLRAPTVKNSLNRLRSEDRSTEKTVPELLWTFWRALSPSAIISRWSDLDALRAENYCVGPVVS